MTIRTVLLALALIAFPVACAAITHAPVGDAASLRAVDEQQRRAIAQADISALEAMAHPDLRINAPTNRVVVHDAFFALMRSGAIGAETFIRTPEDVLVTGNIGSVMGRETVALTPGSDLARLYGSGPLQRRYTNIYVWQKGRWLWLSRHANVIAPTN